MTPGGLRLFQPLPLQILHQRGVSFEHLDAAGRALGLAAAAVEDVDAVVLDGEQTRPNAIHVVEADGVVLENMTAHGYQLNGFYWSSVNGYRGSYLTAWGNGDYGVYAFDSRYGRFEHSYAAGHPDSGFYIGQCDPCDAVIDDVIAVHNALGYSGTNASGNLAIVNSEWTDGLSGITPNTLDSERLAPQHEAHIAGNWIHNNASTDVPAKRLEWPTFGIGIVLAGVRGNIVEGNLVEDNATYGIAVLPNLDDNLWLSRDNEVRGNVVRGSGRADLALGLPSVHGDCFASNAFSIRFTRTCMRCVLSALAFGVPGCSSTTIAMSRPRALCSTSGSTSSTSWPRSSGSVTNSVGRAKLKSCLMMRLQRYACSSITASDSGNSLNAPRSASAGSFARVRSSSA